MRSLIRVLAAMAVWGCTSAMADVLSVCGDVSGVWSADTVLVTCEVRVPPRDTLVIQPGVKVLFQDYCKFIVDTGAVLRAVGTASDTILFDEYVSGNRWRGIRFIYASDSSRLEYCHLTHGSATGSEEDRSFGAILCRYSNITVANCLIDSCRADDWGGAIGCQFSSPTIANNTIRGNSCNLDGGGINCYFSSPVISNNVIADNWAGRSGGGIVCGVYNYPVISGNTITGNSCGGSGGGIGCFLWSDATISGNTISGNTANGDGGGIHCDQSSPHVSGNSIVSNVVYSGSGGGICCTSQSNPTIDSNTVSGNRVGWGYSYSVGAGIVCNYSDPVIANNTISNNYTYSNNAQGGGIYCNHSNATITNNVISYNLAESIYNNSHGGGIHCTNASPLIADNIIRGNRTTANGGGIFCSDNSNPIIQNCVIDSCTASSYGGGIYCENSNPSILGDTLRGNVAGVNGGGIGCYNSSSPTISGNTITGNWAAGNGGSISCYYSNPAILNNTIRGNSASGHAGGIWLDGSSPTIQNCVIDSCSASWNGGAMNVAYNSRPTIQDNTISRNVAGRHGGGIYTTADSDPDTLIIKGNIIKRNSAESSTGGGGGGIFLQASPVLIEMNEITYNNAASNGGGMFVASLSPVMNKNTIACNHAAVGGGVYLVSSSPFLVNCILWDNTAATDPMIYQTEGSSATITYSCLQDSFLGEGNLFTDPLFVDSCADVHLQCSSPAINAGHPDSLYNDPDGTQADMGCYYLSGAFAALSPSSLDFLTVDPVRPKTLSLWLENQGSETLRVSSATAHSPFTVLSFPNTVLPRSNGEVTVSFNPPGNGEFRDTLLVVSNALNEDTLRAPLAGIGEVGLLPGRIKNLVLWTQEADAHLCWSAVDTSIHGNPIHVDYYIVYHSATFAGPFYFQGYTADTCYIHAGVVQFSPAMYYDVTAYMGSIGQVLGVVESLGGRATREEIEARLR